MGRILQFGTSRFLQAHVDLFVHEAREAGQDVGPVSVVKTTSSGSRDARVRAFGRREGYPVIIRGLVGGSPIERTITVLSVERGLSAHADWPELVQLFAREIELAVSNTGDTGFAVDKADHRRPGPGVVPVSFPAKLLSLLLARHAAGGRAITLLPCELVSMNGQTLRRVLTELAEEWWATDAFMEWLARDVVIADTLVDRIVSASIEPIGAVTEPYALWAIQSCPGLPALLEHPDVVVTERLEPYARLKLHILNLGHTVLAEWWRVEQRPDGETVRAMLTDDAVRQRLELLFATEVLPGFAARGMAAEAERYIATTMERFSNPFLDHHVADIAQHHGEKVARRIGAFLDWAGPCGGTPVLARIVEAAAPTGG